MQSRLVQVDHLLETLNSSWQESWKLMGDCQITYLFSLSSFTLLHLITITWAALLRSCDGKNIDRVTPRIQAVPPVPCRVLPEEDPPIYPPTNAGHLCLPPSTGTCTDTYRVGASICLLVVLDFNSKTICLTKQTNKNIIGMSSIVGHNTSRQS